MPSVIETAIRRTITKGVVALHNFNRQRMAAPKKANPFLGGLHAPLDREFTLDRLAVRGHIPSELNGRYLRIGPNPIGKVNPANHHWFMGDGMVHGVRLQDGKALWYRNRWVRSTAVSRALGEAPAPGPRHFSDTVNTNVLGHAGKTWALVEAGGYPVELSAELDTVAHNPFEGSLKGSFSAHAHTDPETGAMHAICYEAQDPDTIRHVVVGSDGKVQREEPIAVRHGPSIHDCMITKNYIIVLDLPVTFSMLKFAAGYGFPYRWNPAHQARVGVLRKTAPGTDIVWCDVQPCYVFHPCNAFETADGKITLDVVAHATMFEDSMVGPTARGSQFERWTIDTVARQVARRVVDAQPQEFPRPDERRMGQPYRYAYTVGLARGDAGQFETDQLLIKHDLETGGRQLHDFGAGHAVSEFVFQPRHASAAENEGWLMGYVVDSRTQTTDFVILDAQHFADEPVAVVTIPHRIPMGFHGNWVSAAVAA
ncbi:MAG: carotenoid oxygenase family protein [Rubrivivax sp.]